MKKRKIIKVLSGIFIAIVLILGGSYYMSYRAATERNDRLIQQGFKLLEEQIATYIKENYSGVSKIEFSPIFVDGGDGFSMFTSRVVPMIYDTEGNQAILGNSGPVDSGYDLGTSAALNLSLGNGGEEIIEILDTNRNYVDVSKYDNLPDFAKLKTNTSIDENIQELNQAGYLSHVNKNESGSPEAEIIYNIEIKEGSYREWP